MQKADKIQRHYTHGNLFNTIIQKLIELGYDLEQLSHLDLTPIDQLHSAGIESTQLIFQHSNFKQGQNIIDIGCGLGGPARYVANNFNVNVTGIDLTTEFIDVGNKLSKKVNLDELVNLILGDAQSLPEIEDKTYHHAYTMHAGMNIKNKLKCYKEAHRLLKNNGTLMIFDITLAKQNTRLNFPLPWADEQSYSFLETIEKYQTNLNSVGFKIVNEIDLTDFILSYWKDIHQKTLAFTQFPKLSMNLIVKDRIKEKLDNIYNHLISQDLKINYILAQK